jgi:hypothetical protein
MSQRSDLRSWLAENPKMMGALWALTLLLAETGTVAAGGMSGP